MERWAANTLRTLGIILTAGFVMITSLLLLLMSLCAAQGDLGGTKHPEQVLPFLLAALGVLAVGIFAIARLARGIYQSMQSEDTTENRVVEAAQSVEGEVDVARSEAGAAGLSVPVHLSPASQKAIDRLVFALGAQIVLSAIAWLFGQMHYWTAPRMLRPHNWTLLAAPFVLYHLPYAILIYVLLKGPDRRAFAYSLAVPGVMIMQALFSLGVVSFYYVQHPVGFVLLLVPWAIHIVILVLAYQVIERVGTAPEPGAILVAALATFVFFSLIHVVTPILYRIG